MPRYRARMGQGQNRQRGAAPGAGVEAEDEAGVQGTHSEVSTRMADSSHISDDDVERFLLGMVLAGIVVVCPAKSTWRNRDWGET